MRLQASTEISQERKSPSDQISRFIAPEISDAGIQDVAGFDRRPAWDVAIRFQDLKRLGNLPEKEKQKLKRRAVQAVIDRAHGLLGSVLKPEKGVVTDLKTFIESGQRGELDVLSTLDETFSRGIGETGVTPEDALRFDARIEKHSDVAVVMDASLSMTGEKIALLAVATAVVALCVPAPRLSLMGFDSRIKWIKRFGDELALEQIIERVLELPAGGFTNMELALKETVTAIDCARKERANVVLISDGKYTEGQDPAYLAPRFKSLSVLKIGKDQAGRQLLLELSAKGRGKFFEARKISELPRTIYGAMKTLLR